ncbi:MAG: hypothetical protein ACXW2G_07940 [Burkholderiaceae bacterium]
MEQRLIYKDKCKTDGPAFPLMSESMNERERGVGREGSRERWAAVAIGVLFIAIAISIPIASSGPLGLAAWIAVGLIAGLGLEAIVSAARNRRCLLSRIGPLP